MTNLRVKHHVKSVAHILSVDKTVAGLQFTISTAGTVTMLPAVSKIIEHNVAGTLYLVYSLDGSTFSGQFAKCSAAISSITNIIGSDEHGNEVADVTIAYT